MTKKKMGKKGVSETTIRALAALPNHRPNPNYSNYIRFVVAPLAAIAALRL